MNRKFLLLFFLISCFTSTAFGQSQNNLGRVDLTRTEAFLDSLNIAIKMMNDLTQVNLRFSEQMVKLTKFNVDSGEKMESLTFQITFLTWVLLFFALIQLLLAFFDKNQLVAALRKLQKAISGNWNRTVTPYLERLRKPPDDN